MRGGCLGEIYIQIGGRGNRRVVKMNDGRSEEDKLGWRGVLGEQRIV
jgi:hypothetical protein